ncbi:MAG TPA: fluoride efflux transporter CrcB [Gemmatimonadales bacterium]|jgi:CrcB protein|nr:fluoride efflux transporter CrcB [Gemmatimonadales bacterium]
MGQWRETVIRFLLVVLGSGIGGGLRLLLSVLIQTKLGPVFPYGTLAVNLAGSFALGAFFAVRERTLLLGPDLWLFLGTGLCGGFTTMSTFSFETLALLRERELYYAGLNLTLTLIGCLAAVAAGYLTLRMFTGLPR